MLNFHYLQNVLDFEKGFFYFSFGCNKVDIDFWTYYLVFYCPLSGNHLFESFISFFKPSDSGHSSMSNLNRCFGANHRLVENSNSHCKSNPSIHLVRCSLISVPADQESFFKPRLSTGVCCKWRIELIAWVFLPV